MIPGARLIILGRQGSGKGTQCVRLSRHFVVPHISTGDMLRAAVAAGTEFGLRAKSVMDGGGLVGDDIMIGVVDERLNESDTTKRGYILDGFPRTVGQAHRLDQITAERPIDVVLDLDVPRELVLERISARRVCRDCGTNYKVVADQAERIENCVLRFRYQGREGESRWQDSIVRGSFRPFAEDGIAAVELSEGFYEALTRHPVPICESAIRLLADTCMPLDIYLWLAYRLHSLEQPKIVTWNALHLQFGASTRLLKHFKPRFARDLDLAMAVYPDAAAELTEAGIRLRPSPPPVPPKLRAVANSRILPLAD